MKILAKLIFEFLRLIFRSKQDIVLENLALRQQWAIQQLRETFAFDETTKYIIRDNDKIFSEDFKLHIRNFGLEDTPIAPRGPWQNPICERVSRTHMSLEKDSPVHRPVHANGKIVSKPILGGLHHVYSWVAT